MNTTRTGLMSAIETAVQTTGEATMSEQTSENRTGTTTRRGMLRLLAGGLAAGIVGAAGMPSAEGKGKGKGKGEGQDGASNAMPPQPPAATQAELNAAEAGDGDTVGAEAIVRAYDYSTMRLVTIAAVSQSGMGKWHRGPVSFMMKDPWLGIWTHAYTLNMWYYVHEVMYYVEGDIRISINTSASPPKSAGGGGGRRRRRRGRGRRR